MRRPNLNALRMFDAAARHLNFRRAAEELNLTQGAVAQQVRQLEADLGLKLFARQARGLSLTEVGRGYHRPIRRALVMIEEATAELQPAAARVVLSVPPSLAAKWLVPVLAAFAQRHPAITMETRASEGLANFQSDGVDLAIRLGSPPFPAGLAHQQLAPLALCAVAAPGSSEPEQAVTDITALAEATLLQDSHGHWERLLEEAGISPKRPPVQFNQTALAIEAAAHGQGIALAPRLVVAQEVTSGRLALVWQEEDSGNNGFHLLYPKTRRAYPARQAVIDWLLAAV